MSDTSGNGVTAGKQGGTASMNVNKDDSILLHIHIITGKRPHSSSKSEELHF